MDNCGKRRKAFALEKAGFCIGGVGFLLLRELYTQLDRENLCKYALPTSSTLESCIMVERV